MLIFQKSCYKLLVHVIWGTVEWLSPSRLTPWVFQAKHTHVSTDSVERLLYLGVGTNLIYSGLSIKRSGLEGYLTVSEYLVLYSELRFCVTVCLKQAKDMQ